MHKVFRLVNAELRKIFLRPTIFIMVALLLLLSFISLIAFRPTTRINSISNLNIDGSDIAEMHNNFISSTSTELSTKKSFDNALYDSLYGAEGIISYVTASPLLDQNISEFQNASIEYDSLKACLALAGTSSSFNMRDCNEKLAAYKSTMMGLKQKFEQSFESTKRFFISQQLFDDAVERIDEHIKQITVYPISSVQPEEAYVIIRNDLRNTWFFDANEGFKALFLDKIKPILISEENYQKIKTSRYDFTMERLGTADTEGSIMKQINDFYLENAASTDLDKKEEFLGIIKSYQSSCLMCQSVMHEELKLLFAGDKSDVEMQKFIGFNEFNRMESQSIITKYVWLLDNGKYEVNYLNALSMGTNSGNKTNAYDFAAFAMNILSVLIILFCIVIASKMIAGEQNNGTMKLLAIRPLTRNKLLCGKLLATMFFSLIFLIFAFVVNMLIGFFVFGPPTETAMIGIYNGTQTIVASPLIFLLLMTLSLFIKIFVFVSLAIMISVIFRSYTGSAIISFVVLILTIVLNAVLGTKNWYKYFPTANFDFYKYFAGTSESSGLKAIFTSPVLPDTSFLFALGMVLGVLILMNSISFLVFKRKDIA